MYRDSRYIVLQSVSVDSEEKPGIDACSLQHGDFTWLSENDHVPRCTSRPKTVYSHIAGIYESEIFLLPSAF